MAIELIPYFEPGTRPTGQCTGTVRCGRLVSISASPSGGFAGTENMQVAECSGGTNTPVGVACQAGVSGEQIPLLGLKSGAVVPLVAGATDITAGQMVMSDSAGRVTPYVGPTTVTTTALPSGPFPVGVALEDQPTTDADVAVWLI